MYQTHTLNDLLTHHVNRCIEEGAPVFVEQAPPDALFGLLTFPYSDRPTRTVTYDRPMVLGRYAARDDMSKAGV